MHPHIRQQSLIQTTKAKERTKSINQSFKVNPHESKIRFREAAPGQKHHINPCGFKMILLSVFTRAKCHELTAKCRKLPTNNI
jgi:hypothetical protein